MKAKVSEIINADRVIRQMPKVDSKLSWRAAMILKKFQPIIESFDEVRRQAAIKHGATEQSSVPEKNMPAFIADVNELAKQEEELEITPFRLSDLMVCDKDKNPVSILSPEEMLFIAFVVDGEA